MVYLYKFNLNLQRIDTFALVSTDIIEIIMFIFIILKYFHNIIISVRIPFLAL